MQQKKVKTQDKVKKQCKHNSQEKQTEAAQCENSNKPPEEFPTLLDVNHLPGPMCMKKLSHFGVFNQLTMHAGYSHKTATSTQGRSNIVSNLIPEESVACAFTAAWVWLGGDFPDNIEIIDYGHRRSKPCGREIRSFRRQLSEDDYVVVGKARITTPERTICDLAYANKFNESYDPYRKQVASLLISHYCIDLQKCKQIIENNPYFPGSVHARNWLQNIVEESKL